MATTIAPHSHAQPADDPESFIQQQRAIELELRRLYDAETPLDREVAFDFGGWYSPFLFLYDDGIESSRTLRRHDLRLWSRVQWGDGAHEIYARLRTSYLDFNAGDSYDGNEDDLEGPNLERGYYRFDLRQLVKADDRRDLPYDLEIKLGRDFAQFGTGLTLATTLDHVLLTATYNKVRLSALAGHTVGSSVDFDQSRFTERTRRAFYGIETRYLGFDRHEPFAYALWQRDRNTDNFEPLLQGYDYDSFYIGAGSTGEIAPRLFYQTELVYEGGLSTGNRFRFRRDTIDAWAFDLKFEYLFGGSHKARAAIEYLFAGGDGDRRFSPTDSRGGNRGGTKDTGFVGFGYRDTGLSFAPRLSNLHLWRAGASFYPWPAHDRLRGLELGTDWFLYHKHHRDGAISDPLADMRSGYLGWEMDYYANWRITHDLLWTARLGAFFPGSSFSDQTTRTFLLVGAVWSF